MGVADYCNELNEYA